MADFEAPFSLRRFLRMVQASVAGELAITRGARLHDRASYGWALWETLRRQLDRRFKATGHVSGVSALIPQRLHQQGTIDVGVCPKSARRSHPESVRKTGRAAGHPSDFGDDHRPRLREMDSVVPRSAGAINHGTAWCGGAAHEAFHSHTRILLAGRPHGAREPMRKRKPKRA